MRRHLLATTGLVLLLASANPSGTRAQAPGFQYLCVWSGVACNAANGNLVSAANPLPVTATFSGSIAVAATAGAASPTYSPGANPFSQNLNGGLRSQLSLGGTDIGIGQQLMAASVPVVVASNQSAIAVTAASLPLPTGAATSANQTTEITNLGSILTAVQATQTVAGTINAIANLGTTNGWTPKILNALGTTVTNVKTTAAEAGLLQCYNANTVVAYVQEFNAAATSVTLGTTAPLHFTSIAPTSTGGWSLANPGLNFGTALSVAATTTATGSVAPSTALDCAIAFN